MKRFISFSGGVESTTMCVLYGKGSTAIWADTGAEHDEMYKRIDDVERILIELHNGEFSLIRVKGSYPYKGKRLDSLETTIATIHYMPSSQKRYCTNYFKIQPIDEFLSQQGECELMIGFNADEEGRTGNLEMKSNVTYSYPLIEDGLTRDDCEDILKQHGFHPNFPVYMLRGGCRMCFFKTKKEFKALYHLNRDEFMKMLELEENYQDGKRKKYYSIMADGKQTLKQIAEECEREKDFFQVTDISEMYGSLKKETSCGAFCHR